MVRFLNERYPELSFGVETAKSSKPGLCDPDILITTHSRMLRDRVCRALREETGNPRDMPKWIVFFYDRGVTSDQHRWSWNACPEHDTEAVRRCRPGSGLSGTAEMFSVAFPDADALLDAHILDRVAAGDPVTPAGAVNRKWGALPAGPVELHPFGKDLIAFVQTHYWPDQYGTLFELGTLVQRFQPAPSVERRGMLALWPDRAAYDRGPVKRLRGKPGRMIRRMLPFLTDGHVECLANRFKADYGIDLSDYVIRSGMSAEHFRHAYTHERGDMADMETVASRKSLAASCMNEGYGDLYWHPAEAYASGDFTIVWAEDGEGRVAARCVVMTMEGAVVGGPVYACNNRVCDLVADHITGAMGGRMWTGDEYGAWEGARLRYLQDGNGLAIGPYLDLEPQGLRHCGDMLEICGDGAFEASETSGLLMHQGICCNSCEQRFGEEHLTDVDSEDFCADCLAELYGRCHFSQDRVRHEDLVLVFFEADTGVWDCETWSWEVAKDYAVFCVDDGHFWRYEDAGRIEGGQISPRGIWHGGASPS